MTRQEVYFALLRACQALPKGPMTTAKDFRDCTTALLYAMRLAREAVEKHKELEKAKKV